MSLSSNAAYQAPLAAVATGDEPRSTTQSWLIAGIATLTMAVSYADRQVLAVLAPTVQRQLHISDTMYGWLLSAFSLAYLVGAPLAGRWIDQIGARRGLTWSVLIWSGIAALHALVPGLAVLFVLRIALGLAEAPSFPGAAQTVHRVLSPEDRPRGFGLLFVGSSLGAMVVPPLATALDHRFGFRMAFVGTAIIGLAWLPVWRRMTRALSIQTLLGGAPRTAGQDNASIWTSLRHPALIRGVLVVLAAAPLMSYSLNWSSKYLVETFHIALVEAGHRLWLPPLLYDLGSIGFGAAASAQLRRGGTASGPPRLLVICSFVLACGLALVPHAPTPWIATALIGVAIAGGGGLFALSTADMLSRIPASAVSTCAGLAAAAQSVAYIVASPLIGNGVQFYGHAPTQGALCLWLLPGCAAWLLWRPPPRTELTSGA